MKLALKILLTILGAAAAAALIWLMLPWLLTGIATQQLEVRGFTDIDFGRLDIRLDGAGLDTVNLSRDGMDIQLRAIAVDYNISRLRTGILDSITVGKLELRTGQSSPAGSSLPDTATIAGLLATPWYNYLPARRIALHDILISSPDSKLSTQASLLVERDMDVINASLAIQSSESHAHRLTLTLSPTGELVVVLRGQDENAPSPLILAAVPGKQPGQLQASLSADLAALGMLFPTLVAEQKGRFSGQLSLVDEAASPTANSQFEVNGHLNDYSGHGLSAPRIDFAADGSLVHSHDSLSLNFSDSSRVTAAKLNYGDLQFGQTYVRFPEQISMSDSQVHIDGGNSMVGEFNDVRQDDLYIGKASVTDLQFETKDKAGKSYLAGRFNLNLSDAGKGDIAFTTTPISLALSLPMTGTGVSHIDAKSLSIDIDTQHALTHLNNCQVTASLPGDDIDADIQCGLAQQDTTVKAKLSYNTKNASGHVNYRISDVTPNSEQPFFRTLLKDWDESYDLVSGRISASGNYRWSRAKESLSMDLEVRDAGGFYSGILFSGLDYDAKLGLLPDIVTRQPSSLSIDIIDVGIPVNESNASIRLKPSRHGPLPLAVVDSLVMHLLDGSVAGKDIKFDFNTDYNEFNLKVSGLNLATVVTMQQVEGLQASGLMDGTVPVFLNEQGLRVINGELNARPPGGQIRYTPEGGTEDMQQAAPGTNIVFEILEDLNYHTLETKVNYVPDGNLILNLAIRGKSPKLDNKRPIHFNLNLEQNVLQLLKSLRIADDIDDVLDKNVRDYYKKSR